MSNNLILFRRHAFQRMAARGITVAEVLAVVASGDVVEDYPTDTPYPSALVLGWANGRPLHVVRAIDAQGVTYIVTAYQPTHAEWDATFRIRRTP